MAERRTRGGWLTDKTNHERESKLPVIESNIPWRRRRRRGEFKLEEQLQRGCLQEEESEGQGDEEIQRRT